MDKNKDLVDLCRGPIHDLQGINTRREKYEVYLRRGIYIGIERHMSEALGGRM